MACTHSSSVVISTIVAYYYSQPGMAQTVDGMVEVESGFDDDSGVFMLTTIRSAKATPILAFWSLFSDFRSLYPAPTNMSDDEYDMRQTMLMTGSQEDAKIAAYQAADIGNVTIEYEGVYVTGIVDGMSADGMIEPGDIIEQVNGEEIQTAEDLLQKLSEFQLDDEVDLGIKREEERFTRTLTFSEFPEQEQIEAGRVGIGISGPVTNRSVELNPPVTISAGAIGGPSAGLMFALEIYSQLEEIDLTKGYNIAGTGTINEDGQVGPIGGANQKIVAADREGADFFLVPNQAGAPGSNFEEASEAAERIGTDMVIVPIDTLDEALAFLKGLPQKESEEKRDAMSRLFQIDWRLFVFV
ncbi:LOW QUALITY PROTEIN: Lon-like protease with PDZ domain [Bacillus sp. JCM 19045]|nr:LOW QUALITY PROTEIN: Lon-like protease with PDZ domain [Bacillus sp. JCM 19045]